MSSRRTPTVWSCRGFSCTCWVALDAHLWCPSQSFDKRVIQLLTVVAYMYIWFIYIYIYLLLHIYIIYPTKHFKFPINTWNQCEYQPLNIPSESSVLSIPPDLARRGPRGPPWFFKEFHHALRVQQLPQRLRIQGPRAERSCQLWTAMIHGIHGIGSWFPIHCIYHMCNHMYILVGGFKPSEK
jgi:hypothetical protein